MSQSDERSQNQSESSRTSGKELAVSPEEERAAIAALRQLPWGEEGMTRDMIRKRYRALPLGMYLRLPSSKHYTSAEQVIHDATIARERAEGEFLDEDPNVPEAESLADGGPPAWGPTPLFTPGGVIDGGSAEDRDEEETAQRDENAAD